MMQGAASMDTDELHFPSKHAGSNSHLIGISSEAVARSRPIDSCRSACFWTRSIWPKPDTVSQNQIGSGLVLHSMILAICRKTQLGLKVGLRDNNEASVCLLKSWSNTATFVVDIMHAIAFVLIPYFLKMYTF